MIRKSVIEKLRTNLTTLEQAARSSSLEHRAKSAEASKKPPHKPLLSALSVLALSMANILYPAAHAAAPLIDLDFVPFQGPGEGTNIQMSMSFSGASFDVGTSGDGVGGVARYSNIGFYNDQPVDLRAHVVALSTSNWGNTQGIGLRDLDKTGPQPSGVSD